MGSLVRQRIHSHIFRSSVIALVLAFLLLYAVVITFAGIDVTQSNAAETGAILETPFAGTNLAPASCRYGAASLSEDEYTFLQEMGVGWTLNFGVSFKNSLPASIEYVPMIRLKQVKVNGVRQPDYYANPPLTMNPGGLGPIIQANPGRLWIVGNEVDRVEWQDDMMPDIYAEAYHDVYHFIKEQDPTAQVAISGLVEVTPGRLQYLDYVWDKYLERYGSAMPVDVWNLHVYVLPEKRIDGTPLGAWIALGTDPALAKLESFDPDGKGKLTRGDTCARDDVYCVAEHDNVGLFVEQVVAMRQWMKAHGQQNKPLILSEYSLLYPFTDYDDPINPTTCFVQDEFGRCFTAARVSKFMRDTFAYLETAMDPNLGYPADNGRLVQQWLWFAAFFADNTYPSNLLTRSTPTSPFVLSSAGTAFRNWVSNQTEYSNLVVDAIDYPVARLESPTDTVTVTLEVGIRNNGNIPTSAPTTVTFYTDAGGNELIGSTVLPAGVGGCARYLYKTTPVLWSGLQAGMHRYWIRINNVPMGTGFALIDPEQTFLPLLQRP